MAQAVPKGGEMMTNKSTVFPVLPFQDLANFIFLTLKGNNFCRGWIFPTFVFGGGIELQKLS